MADGKDFLRFEILQVISPLIFTNYFDLLRFDDFFLRSKQPQFDLPSFPEFFVWILLIVAGLLDQRRIPEFFDFSRFELNL